MAAPTGESDKTKRDGRIVAIVIAVTGVVWLGANWLFDQGVLEVRYAVLFDLAALAAFFWTLVVTYQIWRRQKSVHRGN